MPKVYILSETGNEELGEEVMDLLKASRGPLSYQTRSLKIEEVSHSYMEFEELFSICEDFRIKNTKSVKPDDFVILLSPKPNIKNWFSAPDFKNNIFVHADGWDDYCKQQPKFPIAHEIISNIVQSKLFENNEELFKSVHYESLGCINDYCRLNEHVIKKLESGEVCKDCFKKIKETFKDSPGFPDQIDLTLKSIRKAFTFTKLSLLVAQKPISSIEINRTKKLKFTDYNNLELNLGGVIKVFYILFLKYQDGLKYADFPMMEEEIRDLYFKHLPSNRGRPEIEDTIRRLCNPNNKNPLVEAKSKINITLEETLGPSTAVHYMIVENNVTKVHSIKLPAKFRVFKD
tara:strand:+ start:61 stop:1098 length:1038 start_codon:yes stop_codon:yes gene_type:complete